MFEFYMTFALWAFGFFSGLNVGARISKRPSVHFFNALMALVWPVVLGALVWRRCKKDLGEADV